MKYKYYLLFFLILCISCKKDNLSKAIELKIIEEKKLTGKAYNYNIDLYRPAKLFVYKDKLIVYDDIRKDIFKVFDVERMSYLYSFGEIGIGPNEFIFTDKDAINSSDYFEILDRNKLYYYHITDTIAYPIDSTLFVTDKSAPINNFKKLSDSVYLFTNGGYSGKFDTEFILYNAKQNTKEDVGKVIVLDKRLQEQDAINQASALIKSITVNQRQKKIAAFYYGYPYFKISSDNINYRLYHIQGAKPQDNKRIYFAESYSTDKYLYVMWVEKSKEEIMNDLTNYYSNVLVFDWNGNMLRNYRLDVPATAIAVSHDDSRLYAVSLKEEDINTLYVYDLDIGEDDDTLIQLSNDLFSLNVLKGCGFINEDKSGAYYSTSKDGYNILWACIGQGFNKTYPELESTTIQLYVPQTQLTDIENKMKEMIENLRTNTENFQVQNLTKGNDTIYHCAYSQKSKEYDGSERLSFCNSYIFSQKNKIIDVKIMANTSNIEQYLPHFDNMILSFQLKE